MAIVELTQHPFQRFDLERDPSFVGISFRNDDNAFYEDRATHLRSAFDEAVRRGKLFGFVKEYTDLAREMAARASERTLITKMLNNALVRLVTYYFFLRLRTREHFNPSASVYSWVLERRLLIKARAAADAMQRDNIETCDYDLRSDRPLHAWLMENVRPIIQDYVGFHVDWPHAHIRYADAKRHGQGWTYHYRQHPYGYFHFDEICYSLPIIVYLDDVDAECGPFSYVEGSDKMQQNFILRALHQALWHHCGIHYHELAHKQAVAQLPAIFRGGDLLGAYAGPRPFEAQRIVQVVGPAGQTTLFEGFMLVHAGGHPKAGARKALFFAFRFPRKKVADLAARAAGFVARYRLRRALA